MLVLCRLTQCPGTPLYMSPEALRTPPIYTDKLDVFSLGVVAVQIITRNYPAPGPDMLVHDDPSSLTGIVFEPIPEIERRKNHIDLIDSKHPMLPVIQICLRDRDRDRPSARQLCHQLVSLKQAPEYAQSMQQPTPQERRIQEQEQLIQDQQKQFEDQQQQHQQAIQQMQSQISAMERQLQELEHLNENHKRQICDQQQALYGQQQQVHNQQQQIQEQQSTNQWMQNHITKLEKDIQVLNTQLWRKRYNLQPKTVGNFIATNPHPLPGTPGTPVAFSVTHNSIQLAWSGPELGTKFYSVLYRRMDNPSSQWQTHNTSDVQEVATVSRLAANTMYCFKVRAVDETGIYSESDVSDVIVTNPHPVEMSDPIATGSPPVPGRPGKPMASKVTHNSIHLKWPGPKSGVEGVTFYSVLHRRMDDPSAQWQTTKTQGSQKEITVSGLAARTIYCFKVRGEREGGISPDSEMSEPIATSPPPVPERPGKPTPSKITHNSVHLKWSVHETRKGSIKCFSVFYRRMDDPSAEWQTTKAQGSHNEYTVGGLAAKAVYCFKVCVECEGGVSPDSEMSDPIATSPPPVPGRPGKPMASKVTHNSIHLKWPGPKSGVEGVTFYSVLHRRMDDPSAQWQTTKTQGSQKEITVSGLAARAIYCFKVRGEREGGISPDSEMSEPIATSPPPVPERPGKPIVSKVTHNSIDLTWPGHKSGAEGVTFYSVLYRRMNDPLSTWQTKKTPAIQNQITISGLSAKAVYCFKVCAESESGVSPDSAISEPAMTDSLPVPGRPGKPTASKVTYNSIHLHWPRPKSGGDSIEYYTVLYRQVDNQSQQWQSEKTKDTQTELVVSGLQSKAVYQFKICAASVTGISPESDITDIETKPPRIPERPGKPTPSKITHNSVHLKWSVQETRKGSIECFSVFYRRLDDPSAEWQTTKAQGSHNEYTVGGLAAKAVYRFKVCVECEGGVSPHSEMSDPIATSPPPVPGRPGKPMASKVTHNSIQLKWPGPKSGVEGVTFYSVLHRRMDDPSAQWQTTKTQGSQKEITVSGLAARAIYCFKVRGECEGGISPDSEMSEPIATSPPPVPERPGKPIVSKVTHNSIDLTWPGHKSGAEGVTFYSVLYRRMDDPLSRWQTKKTPAIQNQITISGLSAKAVYCFKVCAESESSVSPDSAISEPAMTDSLPVPGRPGKPTASKVTYNSIHLHWPRPKSGGDSIEYYTVLYRQVDNQSQQWQSEKTKDTQTELVVSGLQSKAVYQFKICAASVTGISPESDITDIETKPPRIPERPGKPTPSKITHNSVHLKWSVQETRKGSIECFSVFYRRLDDPSAEWQTTKAQGSHNEYTVGGLAAKAVYCFKVCVKCEGGVSPHSEMSDPIATSPPPVPGRPGKPMASKVTHNSIQLKWPGPKSGVEGVTFYSVLHRRMDDPSAQWQTTKTQGSQKEITVSGLAARAIYCFKVHGECEGGISPDSEMSEPIATSPPPVPERPGKPTPSKITHNSVHLKWSVHETRKGSIKCFSVFYRRVDDPSAEWQTIKAQGSQNEYTVGGLAAKAVYCFKVRAECEGCVSPDSEISDPILTSPPPVPGYFVF